MRFSWNTFWVPAMIAVMSLSSFAVEKEHETSPSAPRKIFERSNRSIPTVPTEPARELPLVSDPILTCTSDNKRFEVRFEKAYGFEKVRLLENKQDMAPLASCTVPKMISGSGYSFECSIGEKDGFAVTFSYPEGRTIRLGTLFDVSMGRRTNPRRLVCE